MGIRYATREQVARSLEVTNAAYAGSLIEAKIDAASRSAEGFLHRRFYPERRTILKDWPNYSLSPSWEMNLGDQEMITLEAVLSGGVNITSDCRLRRADDLAEPPYDSLEVLLNTSSSLSAGNTFQQSLSILGLFGYSDTSTALAGATLGAGIDSSVSLITLNPTSGTYTIGIGSLILIGSERMTIEDRRMVTSGQTINASVSDIQNARVISSAGAANFAVGETILIGAERMRIDDIAGTNILVTRAWDGTALTTHTNGDTIFALRTCLVRRGALGSTAAAHNSADPVYVHEYNPLLVELVTAETVVMMEGNASAYGSTSGTGGRQIQAPGQGLEDIRDRAWRALCRQKTRTAAI